MDNPNNGSKGDLDASQQLDAIFRAFPELLFCIEPKGQILSYRAGANSYLHLSQDQVVGHYLQELLPPEITSKFEQAIRESLENRKVGLLQYQLDLSGEAGWFEAHLVPSENGQIVTVIIRDVTERIRNLERIQGQLRRLYAHHTVDAAITASFDLKVTLSVILRQMLNQLNADAADILVLNSNTRMLEFAAGLGFQMRAQPLPVMVGQGYAGKAALERRTISIPNVSNQEVEALFSPQVSQEKFANYYAVPLIAKGQVKGVMEIYHRSLMQPDDEWLEFLSTMAGQAAVAIDSATLYEDLQRTNAELSLAYDSAIESWAQILELSNRESGAHAYRVVELTIKLARFMGVAEQELIHFRRGALLHDVGKLGISESILNKDGPLSDPEWQVMQSHPALAYQLLSSVKYLAPALDIPHYHHEHWDGSGYPDGLREEQIPFPARLFAVIDVYDALTSSRPYRSAWDRQEALNYIQENSGKLFDPTIIKAFLQVMREKV